jgi:hypothetical protein
MSREKRRPSQDRKRRDGDERRKRAIETRSTIEKSGSVRNVRQSLIGSSCERGRLAEA